MSIKITVNINSAAATSTMDAIAAALADRQGLHRSIAQGVAETTRDHLDKEYVPRNKRGDFWKDVRNSVEAEAGEDEAIVTLQELGLRLRYEGGEVRPGKTISSYTGELTRALAIPSDRVPVVDGRQIRPGRAGLLAFIRSAVRGETVGYLVEAEEKKITRGKNKGGTRLAPKPGGSLMYTLRTITRHKADKNIIPSNERLIASASEAALYFVESFE